MATYENPWQWNDQVVDWSTDLPKQSPWGVTFDQVNPGYISGLMQLRSRVHAGQATADEQAEYARMEAAARAIPMRDPSRLQFGWNNDEVGSWNEGGSDWWTMINGSSPDLGPVMLTIRDRMEQGTATPQERQLFDQTMAYDVDWNYRASVPQESDANPFGLGDQLFGALFTLGLGATGGLAAAPLLAGGASAATTLGSLGALAGTGGSIAGMLGQATGQEWLANVGKYLGAAGGIAGGVGGLTNLWNTGVQSLGDAARLAQNAGRITGAVGSASGVPAFQQAGRYLGYAGQAGQLGAGAADWLGWSGTNSPLAANVAPTVGQGGVQNLLSAADVATQRGGGSMSEWDWGTLGSQEDMPWAYDMPADTPGWDEFLSGDLPRGTQADMPWAYDMPADTEGGGGGGFWGTLGGLASGAGRLLFGGGGGSGGGGAGIGGPLLSALGSLGGGAGIGGPLLSALGSLGGGAIGSNAANEAARLQAHALNRGIDLQTAQWLQQQQNLAPYLQAGQQGLSTLQGLAGREQPGLPGATPAVSGWNYGGPATTPGWTPQHLDAGAYRWTPGQGPRAQDYRYTPGQTPEAAAYRYTPGAVPTLQGRELLANDPGYQFRQDEARRALEASALASGTGMSGATLSALQRQSQDLASQEYGQAWNRASQQAQLREQWGQAASTMGWGQAEAESRLREQVNQVASQQGWSQAQAEAVFREQQQQLASQQGFNQALQGQQWNQRQQQQWETDFYTRQLAHTQSMYGRDVAENATNYDRAQQAYKQQLAQHLLPFEQQSILANLGGQAVGMYGNQGQNATSAIANLLGQSGTAQAVGTLGSANAWGNTINSGTAALQNVLRGLNA